MKRKVLFISFIFFISLSFAQSVDCPLDENLFSGTLTTSTAGATKIKASDATSNYRFGERVAIDGNIAVATSRSNGAQPGKVYVFINDGSGNWTQQTTLSASDGFAGDNFGSDVAIEGNYVVVGARSQLDINSVDTGAAYLFEYNGVSSWTQVARFEPSDGSSGIRFGESVDIEGDFIIIGARSTSTGGNAYLYENDGTNSFTFTETKLEPQVQSGYSGARFGNDVRIEDGRAYVGGPYDYSSVGRASAGSVQIWDQANDGTWSRTHRLRGTETSESFGWEFDVNGEYLAIGAMNFEVSSTPEADNGRVFVYKADVNGNFLEENKVMIQNDDGDSFSDQRFGSAVALQDGYLYVGCWGSGNTNGDAVYIFKDDGTNNWTQIAKLTSGGGWDEFSNRSVAVSFPNLIIGQNEDDSPSNSGAIHLVPLASSLKPTASVSEVIGESAATNDGVIKVSFNDEATKSNITFSIDGGVSYPYSFDDSIGSGEITGLTQGGYDVWVRFDDSSCAVSLGTISVNSIAYTAIPDTNFEAELFSAGYDDISGDGQVPTDLISNVTVLNMSTKGISDLTGIQDFIALEELKLNNNSLTSLDVSNSPNLRVLWATSGNVFSTIDVSNNTLLEDFRLNKFSGSSIDISNNPALDRFMCTECDISSLNTSSNINLTWLDLEGASISSLDLSSNTALTILEIDKTSLVTLDLSKNTALKSLFADDITTLTSLNIQNGANTSLSNFSTVNTPVGCVLVDDATYSTTNWTNIASNTIFNNVHCDYTDIPDANFEAALNALGYDDKSGDNKVPTPLIQSITTLDVSGKNISDLTGIEDFVGLTDLNVETNTLTSLDVSANTNLQVLVCNENDIASLVLGSNTNLSNVQGKFNELAAVDVTANTGLVTLNLRNNAALASIDVSNNINLQTLNLIECSIAAIDISNLVNLDSAYLRDNNLSAIDLSKNILLKNISLDGMSLTSLDVSNNTLLELLRVTDNSIATLDLSNNSMLTDVECENNGLSFLNIKNGNNTSITTFLATGNPALTCIKVDDADYSTNNWTNVDNIVSFTSEYCRYTTIPDANFEARLEALGYDDISGDGQVPTGMIEVVTNLNVANKSITDLTGIEDFRDLETLVCGANSLTTYDFSKNSKLETLNVNSSGITTIDVTNNTVLRTLVLYGNQLTSIDVTQNTNLRELDVFQNKITSLDVSNNLQLRSLLVEDNDLTSLDISVNTLITELNCANNELTSLNVKNSNNTNFTSFVANNNSSLSCISVDDAAYSTTNWTNIDATSYFTILDCRYTTIPDENFEAELETLGYDDISADGKVPTALIEVVTSLDVGTKGISDLTGIQDFIALTSLRCNDNTIQNLDLRNNTLLEYVKCDDNGMDVLNLENLQYFEELVGYGNDFTNFDFSNVPLLKKISLFNNEITSLDLSNNTALVFIRLDNNKLTSLDVRNGTNTNITMFNASLNSDLTCVFVDDAAYSTTNWTDINSTTTFNELYCAYTAIPDANFEAELEALGYDNISGDGQVPTALIEVVTSLDVSSKSISDLTGIQDFIALQSLDCGDNSLSVLNVGSNTELETLVCSKNSLTALDVTKLTKLKILNFHTNSVASIDVTQNPALKVVKFYDNFTIPALDVSNNPLLEEIEIRNNLLTELNVSNNPLLEKLQCQFNNLTTLDVSNNSALTTLRVNGNDLTFLNVKNGNNTNISTFDSSSNSGLSCILVDDAAYSTANWTNINGSSSFSDTYCQYTSIPDSIFEARLEALGYDDISGDGQVPTVLIETVTSLNVNDKGINDLTGIEDFVALITLNCRGNNLTTLDVSNNLMLERLEANNNDLSVIDLSKNIELQNLNLGANDFTAIDVSKNTALEMLSLQVNSGLTSIDISANVLLEELRTYSTNISSLDLSVHSNLEVLQAYNSALTEIDLSNNPLLEEVRVNGTDVTELDLSNNPNIKSLRVNDTGIEVLDLSNQIVLQNLFAHDTSLKFLNVKNGNNVNVGTFRAEGNPNLNCITVDDVTYSTTNWTSIDSGTTFSDSPCSVNYEISLKVFLQGAHINPNTGEESIMRDDLRVSKVIPTTSPYSDGATCNSSIFTTTGNDAIVDWVWVELRDKTDHTIVLASQSGLIQRDGDIVAIDGSSPLSFSLTENNDVYISINHRSHLGILTATSVELLISGTTIDFTSDTSLVYGDSNAVIVLSNGAYGLISGDYDGNGQVQNIDVNAIISLLGSSGYNGADMDMNGQIQNSDINNLINPNSGKGQQF